MSQPKAYFPVPDYDHAPDKLIKLGQIILDLKAPDSALSAPLLPLPERDTTFKDDWEKERSRTLSGSVGIWGKFLAWILTLGGNLSVNFEKEDANIFKFKKLETTFIAPSQKYIADSMAVEAVKEHLAKYPKTSSAFMVTGLKIARGAEITKRRIRGAGGEGDVSVNAAPLSAVPAEAGPKGSLQRRVVDTESFTASSDFVFAYRLRKITINRKTGDVGSKDYVKGATYSVEVPRGAAVDDDDSSDEDEDKTDEEKGPMVFDIFGDEEDFGLDFVPSGYTTGQVKDDDDHDCRVVFRPVDKSGVKGAA